VISKKSKKKGGTIAWDHIPEDDKLVTELGDKSLADKVKNQITAYAHLNLRWIITMPIPHQVRPFKLACGVLNLDGFDLIEDRSHLASLLADAATAAALIGLINRSSDVLKGQCQRPIEPLPGHVSAIKDAATHYVVDPSEFNPADCPPPSETFRHALAEIEGLGFFDQITVMDVAEFLPTRFDEDPVFF